MKCLTYQFKVIVSFGILELGYGMAMFMKQKHIEGYIKTDKANRLLYSSCRVLLYFIILSNFYHDILKKLKKFICQKNFIKETIKFINTFFFKLKKP
jgi:hypothetical protein